MKISSLKVFRFDLSLRETLNVGGESLRERGGLIVQVGSEDDRLGAGEVSPLPGLSRESLAAAEADLRSLRDAVVGRDVPEGLDRMSGGFEDWLEVYGLSPSVRFGFETAVLGLMAAERGLPLCRLLCSGPRDSITVNGLLSGSADEVMAKAERLLEKGYQAFKLKVGRGLIAQDEEITRRVRALIGDEATLRLDANRAWDMEEALRFGRAVADCRIDYVEEPVKTLALLKTLLSATDWLLPVALDEGLLELEAGDLSSFSGIKAVVLKPTLFGFERTVQTARSAAELGMTPVISSAFESGVGVAVLAHMAACVNRADIPAGLDTLDVFEEDLRVDPLDIEGGRLSLSPLAVPGEGIKQHLLKACRNE